MSVILDALAKARRDREQEPYDQYGMLAAQPRVVGAARKSRLPIFLVGAGSLALLALFAVALYLGWLYLNSPERFGRGVPTIVQKAGQGVPPPGVAVPGQANGPTAASVASPIRGRSEVHFSDGTIVEFSGGPLPPADNMAASVPAATPMSDDLAAAMRPGADLPTPVPVSMLGPEAEKTLPPPPVASKGPQPQNGFTLGAILCDDNSKMAVVNGMTVREGQSRGGFKVLQITPDKVVVQRPGQEPATLMLQ